MIEARGLTRRYGDKTAVQGPDGAAKSTTMRMILGLGGPTAGSATVDGRACTDPGMMHPWAGFALFTGYAALALAGAAHPLKRRDA